MIRNFSIRSLPVGEDQEQTLPSVKARVEGTPEDKKKLVATVAEATTAEDCKNVYIDIPILEIGSSCTWLRRFI